MTLALDMLLYLAGVVVLVAALPRIYSTLGPEERVRRMGVEWQRRKVLLWGLLWFATFLALAAGMIFLPRTFKGAIFLVSAVAIYVMSRRLERPPA